MATIKDVAHEAGVALSTVSKYLNGGNVREENRVKIDEAVRKLNYKVNFCAHTMRCGRSRMVLVMVPQFDDKCCCEIMQTARNRLIENGYIAILAETRGDPKKEQEIVERAIAHQVDGVISLYTEMLPTTYEEMTRNGIPLVVIGKAYRKRHSGCVSFDDAEKFTKLFRRLKECGHYRIGVVGGGVDKARLHSREFSYYISLLTKAGLRLDEDYIYVSDEGAAETGVEAVKYFSRMKEPPTAIVCLNSGLLLGVCIQLSAMNFRVPEDVSVCVLARMSEKDSIYLRRYAAIFQPIEEATERAVSLLLENINSLAEGRSQSQTTVQITTLLRKGESIAAAKDYTGLAPTEQPDDAEN